MESSGTVFNHKTFSLNLCDCTVICMLDDGFFYPSKLTADPHTHLAYELHFCQEGSYRVTLAKTDRVLTVRPGWALLIPPNCYHSAHMCHTESNKEKHWTEESVKKYTLRFRIEQKAAEPSLYGPLCRVLQQRAVLTALPEGERYFRQIYNELRSGMPYAVQAAELALQSLFLQLFRTLLRSGAPETARTGEDPENDADLVRCERIIRYLDAHYALPITERELAREMHLSVRQLSRIFSQRFRATFRQVLGQIRLHHTRKLLTRTALSVEEIAVRVGYGSPSTLYTAFKEAYGMSPRQYRLNARESEENLLI